ncbi:hypothetical protein [Paenibacillus polymyxa]|uniref:hypothetical protein n=1 Tax=Paenibacillus polymyxa TaxID=1406 RepID=UPI00287F62F1|nr:hypothetical protein [Paenibacillus polymyxa]
MSLRRVVAVGSSSISAILDLVSTLSLALYGTIHNQTMKKLQVKSSVKEVRPVITPAVKRLLIPRGFTWFRHMKFK